MADACSSPVVPLQTPVDCWLMLWLAVLQWVAVVVACRLTHRLFLSACTCCVLQDHAGLCQAVSLCCLLSAAVWRAFSPQVQKHCPNLRARHPRPASLPVLLSAPRRSQGRELWVAGANVYMALWLSLSSDPKLEAQRPRLSSAAAADLLPALEGVELGVYGKVNITGMQIQYIQVWWGKPYLYRTLYRNTLENSHFQMFVITST